jgi:hypothetical protein
MESHHDAVSFHKSQSLIIINEGSEDEAESDVTQQFN